MDIQADLIAHKLYHEGLIEFGSIDRAAAILEARMFTHADAGELAAMMTGRLDDDWKTLDDYIVGGPKTEAKTVPMAMLRELALEIEGRAKQSPVPYNEDNYIDGVHVNDVKIVNRHGYTVTDKEG